MCLFPVPVAVVQQSVKEVGSRSLDVRVRCCRMQGRRRWRRVRLKVGKGRRRASRARRPVEVVESRRAERGGGDVRSGGGAEAADAAKPLRAAVRWSGSDSALPSKIAVRLRVRRVDRGASLWALMA